LLLGAVRFLLRGRRSGSEEEPGGYHAPNPGHPCPAKAKAPAATSADTAAAAAAASPNDTAAGGTSSVHSHHNHHCSSWSGQSRPDGWQIAGWQHHHTPHGAHAKAHDHHVHGAAAGQDARPSGHGFGSGHSSCSRSRFRTHSCTCCLNPSSPRHTQSRQAAATAAACSVATFDGEPGLDLIAAAKDPDTVDRSTRTTAGHTAAHWGHCQERIGAGGPILCASGIGEFHTAAVYTAAAAALCHTQAAHWTGQGLNPVVIIIISIIIITSRSSRVVRLQSSRAFAVAAARQPRQRRRCAAVNAGG